jgi:hypothetical protein
VDEKRDAAAARAGDETQDACDASDTSDASEVEKRLLACQPYLAMM